MINTKNLGIMITAGIDHKESLKICIESCRRINPGVIVCGIGIGLDSKSNSESNFILPVDDTLRLADIWFLSKNKSWFWIQKYGLNIIDKYRNHRTGLEGKIFIKKKEYYNSEIDYIFSINGDYFLEKLEEIHEMFNTLSSKNIDIIYPKLGVSFYFAKKETALKIYGES